MQILESSPGTRRSDTCGLELLVAVSCCARTARHPQEGAVGKQHGRSRDKGTRERSNRSIHGEIEVRPS